MVIYKITNKINGKIYVGKTINRPLTRFSGHKSGARNGSTMPIHRAMRKYGDENFDFQVIDTAESHEELKVKEFKWIRDLNSRVNGNGYNLEHGDEDDNPTPDESSIVKRLATKRLNPSKEYVGVWFHKEKRKWGFTVEFRKREITKKRYSTEKDAAIGRDLAICEVWKDDETCLKIMNFPELLLDIRANKIKDPLAEREIAVKKSNYRGVSVCHQTGKWESVVVHKQKRYRIVSFDTQEEAAEMSDWIKVSNNIPSELNFPRETYLKEGYLPPKTASQKNKLPKYISSYVSTNGKTRYRTRIVATEISKCFDTLEEATLFRDELLKNPEAIAAAKADFYAKRGKTVKVMAERITKNLRS
jgi:group I intron endonuclease